MPFREKSTEHFVGVKSTKKHCQLYLTPSRLFPPTRIFSFLDVIASFFPQLARQYPNMKMELQGAVISAPFLNFSPGNLSLAPQMEIEAFVLLPNSVREPIFRLGVVSFKTFANAVLLFLVCIPLPPAPTHTLANFFRSQLKYHFFREAFLDCL